MHGGTAGAQGGSIHCLNSDILGAASVDLICQENADDPSLPHSVERFQPFGLYPRFPHQRFVGVISDGVPNGIPYEIKSHCFDEEHCAESMELEVSREEPLAKA